MLTLRVLLPTTLLVILVGCGREKAVEDRAMISAKLSAINASTPEGNSPDELEGLVTPGPKRRGEQMRAAVAQPSPPK
jgi:hypothetical protein